MHVTSGWWRGAYGRNRVLLISALPTWLSAALGLHSSHDEPLCEQITMVSLVLEGMDFSKVLSSSSHAHCWKGQFFPSEFEGLQFVFLNCLLKRWLKLICLHECTWIFIEIHLLSVEDSFGFSNVSCYLSLIYLEHGHLFIEEILEWTLFLGNLDRGQLRETLLVIIVIKASMHSLGETKLHLSKQLHKSGFCEI